MNKVLRDLSFNPIIIFCSMDTVNIFYLTRYHDRIFLFSWNYRIKTIDLFSYLIRHIWICPQVLLAPAWGASVRCLSCSVISTTFAVLLNPLTTVTGWAHLSRWPTWWTQCLVKTSDHTSVDVPSVRQTPRWVNHYKLFCISLAKYLLMFSWNCNIKSSMMYQTRGCSNMCGGEEKARTCRKMRYRDISLLSQIFHQILNLGFLL